MVSKKLGGKMKFINSTSFLGENLTYGLKIKPIFHLGAYSKKGFVSQSYLIKDKKMIMIVHCSIFVSKLF